MERCWIRGARVLDPERGEDRVADVLLDGARIEAVENSLPESLSENARCVDARGRWLAPGFVDMHVHLREPGQEYKEDIASGGRAAVAGGFSAVACMANTDPVNDDPAVTDYIQDRARQDSPARVHPIAAATQGLEGQVMSEMSALRDAGAVAFSDDGRTIMDSGVMRRVLEYSRLVGAPVIVHAEDCHLVGRGVVNEGPVSTRLGLPGNPCAAEEIQVGRDLSLARLTGAHLHVAHVSSAGAIERIPHHLSLTDEATTAYDTNTKMAPPLRSASDVEACRRALAEGVLDAIATDHAPHAVHEKEVDFCEAPPGILGLETAFAVVMDLVREGRLSPLDLVDRLSTRPAAILGVPGGRLQPGEPADLVLLDPELRWGYDPAKGYSKSRNSPWAEQELVGRAVATWVGGVQVYDLERGVLIG